MPPSLKLPDPVTDLSATRTGNQVALTWTMPRKSTDKLLLKGNIAVRICRKEGAATCEPVANTLSLAPGADGAFTETLPAALASGPPRPLSYLVDLPNHSGRTAGDSNPATVLAGEAPAPVANLSGTVTREGIALSWARGPAASPHSASSAIRLHRKLLRPQPARPNSQPALLAPQPEPVEQTLLVDLGAQPGLAADRALDNNIRPGETYEYRAQRVARIPANGQTLELAGELSAPIRVEAADIFPPAVPTGLAAVATVGENGAPPTIDLSWQPVTDSDLAGYALYRREGDNPGGTWERISPPQPLVPPAFRDDHVLPGHSYGYAVSAIGQNGHESARSVEAEETVPTP